MSKADTDSVFAGSIPKLYETYLVPLIFEPYAADLARRLNEFADAVTTALATVFPADPPRFMARTPHGYFDRQTIERDLAEGGFARPARFETVAARSRAESPRIAAVAYCQGTPLRNEIEARDASLLGKATDVAADAIARRFGPGAVDSKIQAHVVTVES